MEANVLSVGEFDKAPTPRGPLVCLRQSEVQHFHRAIVSDLDIGRLQIPMDHAFFMRRLQGVGNLLRQIQRFFDSYRTTR